MCVNHVSRVIQNGECLHVYFMYCIRMKCENVRLSLITKYNSKQNTILFLFWMYSTDFELFCL